MAHVAPSRLRKRDAGIRGLNGITKMTMVIPYRPLTEGYDLICEREAHCRRISHIREMVLQRRVKRLIRLGLIHAPDGQFIPEDWHGQ